MKKRIGLLGAKSHESMITYYRRIIEKYIERTGDYSYPEIVIVGLNFQKMNDLEKSGDKQALVTYVMTGIDALTKAGVDFIAIVNNVTHAVFPEVQSQTAIPMISIVETTVEEAKRLKVRKALLLGTKVTMQSTFYQDIFAREGIEVIVPTEEEQETLNAIIDNELVKMVFKPESRKKYVEVIESYDVDAVIFACTEIPWLVKEKDVSKIVLDPTELHVEAILKHSLNEA